MFRKLKNYFTKTSIKQSQICEICMQNLNQKTSVQLCNCKHTYCHKCVTQYVNSKIKAYQVIKCLDENCTSEISQKCEFYTSLNKEKKQKYEKIKRFYFVSKNPEFKLCPKETCQGLVNTQKKPCLCNKCSQKYCPKCLYKEHWGKCEKESIIHLQNDLKYIQCSHCNFVIEKNEGCDHITCKCGYQLCYRCGGVWKGAKHMCIRSKGFHRVRQRLVWWGQKLNFIRQNPHFRKLEHGLGSALINTFYVNLVIALIFTVLETIYKIACVFSPFDYISEFFNEEQIVEEIFNEEGEDGFPYFKVYLCLVFACWLLVRKWMPKHQMGYFIMAVGLLTILFYIVSNLFWVYYYEWVILMFLTENIIRVTSFILGICLFFAMFNLNNRQKIYNGFEWIRSLHMKIIFGRRQRVPIYE